MEQNYRPTMNDVLLSLSRWKYYFGDENRVYDELNNVYREVLGVDYDVSRAKNSGSLANDMKVFENAVTAQCPELKPAIDKVNHLLSRYDYALRRNCDQSENMYLNLIHSTLQFFNIPADKPVEFKKDIFRDFELTRHRFTRTYVIPAVPKKDKGRWKDRGSRD